uniref:Small, acid-soluble spore protein H n=1 Tax=Parastrongyloides trichosuri TaxID=131310 RepID=A0A0N5A232_PARTI
MIGSQDIEKLCKFKNQKCRIKRHNGEYVEAVVEDIENGKVTVFFIEEGKMYLKRVSILDFQIWNSFSLSELKQSDKKLQKGSMDNSDKSDENVEKK